jgi:hypothetical protein
MKTEDILRYLLPPEILDNFDLVEINEVGSELELSLDEKPIKPKEHNDKALISYGFEKPVRIQDFPIRERGVTFIVRRRKWFEKDTGKIYSNQFDLTAQGTSYTKDFADFLKEVFRQLPHQQQ